MQPKGSCQYIFDSISNVWVPWEGTVAGFGGVTLFAPNGIAIDTPDGQSDNVVGVEWIGAASFNYGYDAAGVNWDRIRSFANNADALATTDAGTLAVSSFIRGFNGVTFDRIQSFAGNADAVAVPTLGLLGGADFLFGFNGTTWDRLRSFASNANGVATVTSGLLGVATFGFGFTGSIWDRLRTVTISSDAFTLPTAGLQGIVNTPYLFNGATFDRPRVISSTNLALAAQLGVQAVSSPGNWSITHTPAANTQATISRAATASTRHVCTSISATLSAQVAATSGDVQINLRDGATGAGTILWSQTARVGGASSLSADRAIFLLSGLSIFGSVNTAMTLEFSAAGGANIFESVALTGYSVT